ncbi:molybdopterin biosynthesis protein [Rhodovulum sulfidophilum]|uniref:molybdopterin biosynthesis protein n=1 Tax=Rhodovulum sulfidophilum TaxID=35806 RepID=UPI001F41C7EC|nr:molybdopterin biosynthesis protein [Rhodovulum sulfidophilum]MCE8458145.1 molybdopterin biosynthesis protein [Rhodovulum sulfidophilum]
MRFGPVPPAEARGAILAHSMALPGRHLPKGSRLGPAEITALREAGIAEVTVARLDPGDVVEDAAAARLANALVPDPEPAALRIGRAARGRVNLHAVCAGVVGLDLAAVQAVNRVDPGITLATLAPLGRVLPGMLVGTVKILPYAVPGAALEAACATGRGALRVHPVRRRSAGLILSEVPGQKPALTGKGRSAVETRLSALGITLEAVRVVPHEARAMAAALEEVEIEVPLVPVVANVRACGETDPATIRTLLVDQVTGAVRWRESVAWMAGQGVSEIWEIGAGKALSGMVKRIAREVATRQVGTPDEVTAAVDGMNAAA